MPIACHSPRWWDWCVSKNEKKEVVTQGNFQDKEVKIKVDKDGKERFCGWEVCKILEFRGIKLTPLRQVKQAYKTDLKSLELTWYDHENPLSYHEGKAVDISKPWVYQLIFLSKLEAAEKFRG